MRPVDSSVRFPAIEESVLLFWEHVNAFQKSLDLRKEAKPYVFYDGPPFATGLPHYGNHLAGIIKDIIPRYWTMRGFFIQRRFGWDCHGLPVEFEMEKRLALNGRSDIEAYGVAKFNEACRSIVLRYSEEWRKIVLRMGRWVDFDNDYKTMDTSYMESVWWVFKKLWDQGLIYEDKKIVRYSPRITAVLSNFEAGLNYKTIQDPSVTLRFAVDGEPNTYVLAWTTTPWTLISNLALAVGPGIDYVHIRDRENGHFYYLAKSRLSAYYADTSSYELIASFPGNALVGKTYTPLFDFFADRKSEGAFRILAADFVSTEDGTGIVHMAPAYGEDDHQVCKANGIDLVDPVDEEGCFTDEILPYQGLFVRDANKQIMKDLKDRGLVVKHDTLTHSYPHCYRSDTPLIYKAISTWYVKVEGQN